MVYFTEEYNNFFKSLAANNYREWFHEHKSVYESAVKKPFEKFISDLIAEIAKYEPEQKKLTAKDAIFRIHRDTRFSKDKTPYKLSCSAVISPAGRSDMQMPGTYIEIGVGSLMIGGGAYMPDKEQIEKIRTAIIHHPEKIIEMENEVDFVKLFGTLKGDKNKKLPKIFSEWQEKLPLIANKQFYYMAEYQDDELLIQRDDFINFVMKHYMAAKNWQSFLREVLSVQDTK
jgi:uncharacterized protein (TIGR02453 family)